MYQGGKQLSQEIKQKCALYTSTTLTVVESTDSGSVSLEKRKKEAAEPIYLSRF
jgi:hypothetical protein